MHKSKVVIIKDAMDYPLATLTTRRCTSTNHKIGGQMPPFRLPSIYRTPTTTYPLPRSLHYSNTILGSVWRSERLCVPFNCALISALTCGGITMTTAPC